MRKREMRKLIFIFLLKRKQVEKTAQKTRKKKIMIVENSGMVTLIKIANKNQKNKERNNQRDFFDLVEFILAAYWREGYPPTLHRGRPA